MARIDTLANFLTDVATAIKSKTGKTDAITPANFDTEINSIEVGGGGSNNNDKPTSSVLPSGYTQLEYVSARGTQYIDTGFKPTEKTNFEVTFVSHNGFSSNQGSIFGTRYTYNSQAYHLCTFDSRDNVKKGVGCFIFGSQFYTAFMKTDGSKQSISLINGLYTGGDGTTTDLSYVTTTPPDNLYLFAAIDTLGKNVIDYGSLDLYYCSFSENGSKVREFIPARNDNDGTIGLYDTVTDVFYTSNTNTQLIAGPEITVSNTPTMSLNVFIQDTEPDAKSGIWVQTNEYTNSDITVAIENDITFGESGWAETGTYANLPQGNGYACAAELDGKMYFGGGHQNNKLFEYDMDTNVYTELPNIPYNFGWGGMNGYNGELYIFGGKHDTTTAYKYNPTTQTYTQLADIPVGFVSAISVTLGDKIYLVTGRPFESSSTRYNTIYEYNPADNTYRLCNATIHSGDCKGATSYKGYLYIFGGDQENRTCYRYNPRTDTSKKMGSIPFDCTDTYACATDDAIYLVGSSGSPNALWKYEPGADKYTQLPDTSISTWGPASGSLLKGKYLFAIGDTINHNRVQVYTISDKTYINTPTNGLLIDQYDKSIETMFTNPIKSLFSTVKYYANGEEINVEMYYGDGTDWIKL